MRVRKPGRDPLDDASMAVEADDDATPGSLLHGDQIVATDEDDHDERPASPADASAAPPRTQS